MSDKERIQININLSAGQMEQLRTLAVHYGSISAAVRVALDALWREYVRNQNATTLDPPDKTDNTLP